MRTVSSAASSVASGDAPEQVFYDAELRDSKKQVVEAPIFSPGTHIADTHAHLDMLHYPELILARAAAQSVSFIVSVIDPTEDPNFTLDNLKTWQREAELLLEKWSEEKGAFCLSFAGLAGEPEESGLLPLMDSPAKPANDITEHLQNDITEHLQNDITEHLQNGSVPQMAVPEVRLIMGCHPHNAAAYTSEAEEHLVQALTTDARVVGIGEVGLDYHYDNSPRDMQQQVFRRQIRLAHELGSTITLHMREAHDDGLRILKEEGVPKAGVLLHCFNLDYATLEPFLELGAMVAFGGPLTFKKADEVRDSAARCPLNRIVTETDCPFMAPVPVRGSICEPASVVFVADVFRSLREEPNALELAYANATRFFS